MLFFNGSDLTELAEELIWALFVLEMFSILFLESCFELKFSFANMVSWMLFKFLVSFVMFIFEFCFSFRFIKSL